MDLRAKINAQLGFHLEAERCWMLAARADPTNPLYPLALQRLRHPSGQGIVARGHGLTLIMTAALALLVGMGIQQFTALRDVAGQLSSQIVSDREQWEGARQRHADVLALSSRQFTDLDSALAGLSEQIDREMTELARESTFLARLNTFEESLARRASAQSEQVLGYANATNASLADVSSRLASEQSRLGLLEPLPSRIDELEHHQIRTAEALGTQIEALLLSTRDSLSEARAAREQMTQLSSEIQQRLEPALKRSVLINAISAPSNHGSAQPTASAATIPKPPFPAEHPSPVDIQEMSVPDQD
jgi:hypothetical protein